MIRLTAIGWVLVAMVAGTTLGDGPFLRVQGERFVDTEGRQVLLHGMNVISKSKTENYLSWHGAEEFAAMRRWGMNCVRLGIIWDGVEPEPGQYDDAYLDGVARRVAWAAENDLYVFLDMHQDLYSVLYSDGAPEWATLQEGKPHAKGAVWSDSYMVSPAVQTAFDNFWANKPAADGVGIQDHYAAAWRHVAKRFADDPTVIGYDLMNEPFPGSVANEIQAGLLQSEFAVLLGSRLADVAQSPEDLAALWLDPEGRKKITDQLEDMEVYRALVTAQEKLSRRFEQNQLQSMFQRVADAIREVDRNHLLLLETSYYCNAGVRSSIEPLIGPDGQRDPRQAFVPHGYDIVVDTPALAQANTARVEFIFAQHGKTATRLAMPMVIGEWGAFGNWDERILLSARVIQRLFEELLCGDTYWDYGRDVHKQAYFPVLRRSIPCCIAGTLQEYHCDPETGTFRCSWQEQPEIDAPTIVFLTKSTLAGRRVRVQPSGSGYEVRRAAPDSGDVFLEIEPIGKAGKRSLMIE